MKKVITMLLISCLMFSANVLAVEPNETTAPPTQGEMPARGEMPPQGQPPQGGMPGGGRGGMQPPSDGTVPQGGVPAFPEGETVSAGDVPEKPQEEIPVEEGTVQEGTTTENDAREGMRGRFPGAPEMGGMPGVQNPVQETEEAGSWKDYSTHIVSVLLLIGAFVFVKFYKRKQY